jgi:hypothetical protein
MHGLCQCLPASYPLLHDQITTNLGVWESYLGEEHSSSRPALQPAHSRNAARYRPWPLTDVPIRCCLRNGQRDELDSGKRLNNEDGGILLVCVATATSLAFLRSRIFCLPKAGLSVASAVWFIAELK